MDSLAAHIAVLDGEGRIVATNEAWERFAQQNGGVDTQTGIGVNYLHVCQGACGESSEGADDVFAGIGSVLAGHQGQFSYEYPCHSREERRWFLLQVSGLSGGVDGAVLLHINITQRKLLEGKLLEHEKLKVLTTGLMNGQEDERRRIARELHDGLNQEAALLAIEMGMMIRQLPEESAVRQTLVSCQQKAVELSDHIRRISHQLHPAALEHLGLVSALRAQCDEFAEKEGIETVLEVNAEPKDPSAASALCIYRVVQESLRNIAKHARASKAVVRLNASGNDIDLAIRDNGAGFDSGGRRGLGLASMEERVEHLGGCFSVTSESGHGTLVEVRLPLGEESNEKAAGSAG